jgi:hypothetical protein
MRSARLFLPLALLLVAFATGASAQSLSATPDSFYLFSAEATMDLNAGGSYGLDHNDVVFSGPGDYTMFIDGVGGSFMEVSVPTIVTTTAGTWNVQVFAYDTPDGTPRVFGPASFSVVARPQTDPPLISIPENVDVAATSDRGAVATFSVSAQNVDGSPVPITCNHDSGDVFPLGTTTVNCSATNDFGTTSGSFPVFVSDVTVPVLSLPGDIVTTNPVVSFTVTATDDLDPSPLVACSPASGSTFPAGDTIVRCSAADNLGNVAFGTFKVSVVIGPPTLALPADITAEAISGAGAVVTYIATADEAAPISCNPASGSTFPLGTTTVNCSATNLLDQTTTGSFHVSVVDTTPPFLILPSDITAPATSGSSASVTFTATATDLVDGIDTVTCTPASGSTFPIGTANVQCSATDLHGNTAHGSFNVTVTDPFALTPPLLSQAITSCGDLTVSGGLIDSAPTAGRGNVLSNGNIKVTGGKVDGDAVAGPGKTVTRSGSGTITGAISSAASPFTCSMIDLGALSAGLASANDNASIPLSAQHKNPVSSAGDFNLSGGDSLTLQAGTYFFHKFTLSGGSTVALAGPVRILTTADVNVSGGSIAGANQWLLHFWSSATKFVVSSSTFGGFVYAPSATLTVSAGTVAGGVYGGAVTVSGNAHVTRTIDSTPPVITITSPLDNETVADLTQVTVHGTVIDPETPITSFQVNGADVAVASNGSFTVTLGLSAGGSTISATATNAVGLSATKTITVQ